MSEDILSKITDLVEAKIKVQQLDIKEYVSFEISKFLDQNILQLIKHSDIADQFPAEQLKNSEIDSTSSVPQGTEHIDDSDLIKIRHLKPAARRRRVQEIYLEEKPDSIMQFAEKFDMSYSAIYSYCKNLTEIIEKEEDTPEEPEKQTSDESPSIKKNHVSINDSNGPIENSKSLEYLILKSMKRKNYRRREIIANFQSEFSIDDIEMAIDVLRDTYLIQLRNYDSDGNPIYRLSQKHEVDQQVIHEDLLNAYREAIA